MRQWQAFNIRHSNENLEFQLWWWTLHWPDAIFIKYPPSPPLRPLSPSKSHCVRWNSQTYHYKNTLVLAVRLSKCSTVERKIFRKQRTMFICPIIIIHIGMFIEVNARFIDFLFLVFSFCFILSLSLRACVCVCGHGFVCDFFSLWFHFPICILCIFSFSHWFHFVWFCIRHVLCMYILVMMMVVLVMYFVFHSKAHFC